MTVTLLLGIFAGYKLDQRWETQPWLMITGSFVGLAAGLYNFLRQFLGKK